MTWPHLLRTAMVAILGTIALALASHARAEGGEEPSLVSPDQAEAFAKASAAAEAPDPAAPAEPAAEKPAKASGRKTGKIASPVPEAAAETQAVSGVAPAAAPTDAKSGSRQADAVRAVALKPLIARQAAANGLPYELADAIIRLESRYNAGARNGPNMGLTQINVRTAQSLGYQGAAAGLLDAETNLRYGLRYLAGAYKLAGGDTCGTILRYQFGHRTQTMTGASRVYCAKVKVITAAAN
jgi:soluble lytic murein transglycosylase-like protein